MATYYVAPGGGDNAAGTNAAPFKTMARAKSRMSAGDVMILKAGVTNESFSFKDDIIVMGQPGAIIDGSGLGSGDLIRASETNGWTLENLEIRNSGGAGVTAPKSHSFTVRGCKIHDCNRPGLIARESDLFIWEDNEVYNCAKQIGINTGSQGISVLNPDQRGGATPASMNGYRIIIRRNKSHDNIPQDGAKTDGCGIIIDRGDTEPYNYAGPILIQLNLCWKNGGPGIRVMESKYVTVEYNTCWNNMQDKRRETTWGAEYHETLSRGCIWRYNIGYTTNPDNNTHAYQNTNMPSSLHGAGLSTFYHNVWCGPATKHVKRVGNGPLPDDDDNRIGQNPKFVNAAAANFALQAGSPALGYGAGGAFPDAGAIQTGATPPTDPLRADAAPTCTPTGAAKSGQTATYAVGTYTGGSGTLTTSAVMQVHNGSTWENIGSAITPGTITFPTVTSAKDFSILETGTKGGVSVQNRSAVFLLSPADATGPTTPTEPVDLAATKARLVIAEADIIRLKADMTDTRSRLATAEGLIANDAETRTIALDAQTNADAATEAVRALEIAVADIIARAAMAPEGYTVKITPFMVISIVPIG